MLNNLLKYTLSLSMILLSVYINAQSGANSPFSRFGLGDLNDDNPVHLRSMGGLSASYTDVYHSNIKNPAALAFQKVVSYDVGLNLKYASLKDPNEKSGIYSGNLEYLSFTLPLFNTYNDLLEVEPKQYWFATNFTLAQHSDVSYQVIQNEILPDIGSVERTFAGNGGTYKAQWGNSYKYKNFSVGLNMGYLFGQLTNERNLTFQDLEFSYDNSFIDEFSMRGFIYNVGGIYQHVLNKKEVKENVSLPLKVLNIGFYGNSTTSFSTNSNSSKSSFLILGNSINQDSLSTVIVEDGEGTMPSEFGIGATYYVGTKLALGVNYSIRNWSKYRNDARPEELSNTSKITFGGYYRPNIRSFQYKDRMYYRFGVFYGQDPRTISSSNLDNYGITLGTGLPLVAQRKISHLNLGLTLGRRGSSEILRETYISLGVGFTFNDDEWFVKRKYN